MKKLNLLLGALAISSSLNAMSLNNAPTATSNNNMAQFDKMQEELLNFFNSSFHSNIFPNIQSIKNTAFNTYPKMNIFEDANSYTYEFALAGMKKNDIKVSIDNNNVLSVSGEHKKFTKLEKKNLVSQERFYGKFYRSMKLAKDINPKKIDITFKDAILKIVIQKDKNKMKNNTRILQIK